MLRQKLTDSLKGSLKKREQRVVSTLRREGLLTAHGSTEVTVDVPKVLEALRRSE